MIRRLLEVHYLRHRADSNPIQQRFWLRELRTPGLLFEACALWPDLVKELIPERPLLRLARQGQTAEMEDALLAEERDERLRDRAYWMPLKVELEHLRQLAKESRNQTENGRQ